MSMDLHCREGYPTGHRCMNITKFIHIEMKDYDTAL